LFNLNRPEEVNFFACKSFVAGNLKRACRQVVMCDMFLGAQKDEMVITY
jgi:hypothetical protein